MAASLTTEPTEDLYFSSEHIIYEIATDALAATGTIKKIGYQVFTQDVGGGNLKEMCPLKTRKIDSLTDTIRFSATELLKPSLNIEIPSLDNSVTPISSDGFSKEFFIRYVEISIDTTTGIPTYVTDQNSATKKIVDAYIQDYQDMTKANKMVMTEDSVVHIAPDQHEWIRAYGVYDVSIRCYRVDNPVVIVLNYVGSDALIPVGPAQLPLPDGTFKYEVAFDSGEEYTYKLINSCCPVEDRVDIYFLTPKGSWQSISFECSTSETVNRSITELCLTGAMTNDVSDLFKTYGRRLYNNRSWMSLRLRYLHRTHYENIERIRSFANARQYRAVYRYADGNKGQLLAPIIPEITSIPVNNAKDFFDFEFEAYYGLDLRNE